MYVRMSKSKLWQARIKLKKNDHRPSMTLSFAKNHLKLYPQHMNLFIGSRWFLIEIRSSIQRCRKIRLLIFLLCIFDWIQYILNTEEWCNMHYAYWFLFLQNVLHRVTPGLVWTDKVILFWLFLKEMEFVIWFSLVQSV
jgi:hypothetical protein